MRIASAILMLSLPLHGQAVLKGKFVRNQEGGQPVVGVNVRAAGANPDVSKNPYGDFVLKFPSKKPGDKVTLTVNVAGLVVVNWVQLDAILPGDADSNELTLFMARESEREEMARQFFKLKSFDAIEANYKRLLRDANQDKVRLQTERDQAKAAASKAAEELAKFQPGQGSEMHQTAMRLFAEGKIDQALQTLDEVKLRQLSQAARERKGQAEKQLAQATESWLLRARLLTTKFSFAEAEKSYEEAVRTSPEDLDALFAFAYFLKSLNKHGAARQHYEQCLALARVKGDSNIIATTLNNLGVLHSDQNRMEEARKAYDEALATYRQLARSNPDTYLPYVARVLWGMGGMHAAMNQPAEARGAFAASIEIFQKFAAKDPAQYLPYVNAVKAELEKVPQ